MTFGSVAFLTLFAVVWACQRAPLPWTVKKAVLVAASYLFYASWTLHYLPLLLLTTVADFKFAARIHRETDPRLRLRWCVGSVCLGLGLLAAFKYRIFLSQLIAVPLAWAGMAVVAPAGDDLPLGISFYTFESISYVIDVYAGRVLPAASLLDYALFISFFPHLLAGPIVRARDFLSQCATPRRATGDQIGWGLTLATIGLFMKTIADQMGVIADRAFNMSSSLSWGDAWVAALAFSGQIFGDFCGYSTCAIGFALVLGFVLNANFNCPYAADGFTDFWRRWHISLSTWLRDYLYIPLGGNRHGGVRMGINLMLTMLLGGLWHGAAWKFVAWGGIHGAALAVERMCGRPAGPSRWRPLRILGTFAVVTWAWVFFRAADFANAWAMTVSMIGLGPHRSQLDRFSVLFVLLAAGAMVGGQAWLRAEGTEAWWRRQTWWVRAMLLWVMIATMIYTPELNRDFIYFRF